MDDSTTTKRTCPGCCKCLGISTRQRRPADDVKIADSNRKYTHLMAAARDCFSGNVPEVWARADRLVRVKFKQQERDQCNAVGVELQSDRLSLEEIDFLLDMMGADRDHPESRPLNAALYDKLSQLRLEGALAECDPPEEISETADESADPSGQLSEATEEAPTSQEEVPL